MNLSKLYRLAIALPAIAFCFLLAAPLYAQTSAPASAPTTAGKVAIIAVGVAGIVQAVKGVINSLKPGLIKGRVAVFFTLAATIGAYFATVDVHSISLMQLLVGLFSSSGVFATVQALVKGQS